MHASAVLAELHFVMLTAVAPTDWQRSLCSTKMFWKKNSVLLFGVSHDTKSKESKNITTCTSTYDFGTLGGFIKIAVK
jgi:hypothetical protein